jgi:hypothetical protein
VGLEVPLTLLGQQELLPAEPRRRLIVPDGHTAWWGVDPSTKRVAIAGVVDGDHAYTRWAKTASFPALDGAERLSAIYSETRRLVEGVATCCPWPGVVVVEQPGGKSINWPLYLSVGVIVLAVHDGLYEVTDRHVKVELVAPATWKKRACGRGDIYKPKVGDTREYGVLTWARENGYTGNSYDEADAMGIAEAARREVLLEVR